MLNHPWPYPRWIAHRGAGKLAPENTLAAFRLGASYGYRMFECDVKFSADDVLFLLHDNTLARTSDGAGIAGELPWSQLSQLDAGSWHSRQFAGEPLPTLVAILNFCARNGYALNIEIKPTIGHEFRTGQLVATCVATFVQQFLQNNSRQATTAFVAPLLTSFSPSALAGAQAISPELPRGLLVDTWWTSFDEANVSHSNDWFVTAQSLACCAIVANHKIWDASTIKQVHAVGAHALCYTVNDEDCAQKLWELGLDGIITDRIDLFAPN